MDINIYTGKSTNMVYMVHILTTLIKYSQNDNFERNEQQRWNANAITKCLYFP